MRLPTSTLLCLAALPTSFPALAAPAQEPMRKADAPLEAEASTLEPARKHVLEAIEKGRYRGAVAVVERAGERELTLAAGEGQPGRSMETDAIFRIYSMTKPITAVAALLLVDEEKLALDAPVSRYLPELEDLEVLVETPYTKYKIALERVACARPMTVRDLLTHTSGLTYGFFDRTEADRLMLEADVLGAGVTGETMIERLATVPLKHQPGTRFEYGVSSDVLGRVVEVVSEKPLDEFFEERIFGPLGMVDTGFTVPEAKRDRVAACHVRGLLGLRRASRREALDPKETPTFLSGGGGLFSTADDYLRFCNMLLGDGALGDVRILKEETARAMMSDQLDGKPAPMLALSGGAFGYGLAVHDVTRRRGPQKGTVWWGGIAGTGFWVDRDSRAVGVFMIQTMNEIQHSDAFRSVVYRSMGR